MEHCCQRTLLSVAEVLERQPYPLQLIEEASMDAHDLGLSPGAIGTQALLQSVQILVMGEGARDQLLLHSLALQLPCEVLQPCLNPYAPPLVYAIQG